MLVFLLLVVHNIGDTVDEPVNGGGDGPAEATFSRFMRCFISLDFAFSCNEPMHAAEIGCKMHFKLNVKIQCNCISMCIQNYNTMHSLIISREGLILTLSILPCPQERIC